MNYLTKHLDLFKNLLTDLRHIPEQVLDLITVTTHTLRPLFSKCFLKFKSRQFFDASFLFIRQIKLWVMQCMFWKIRNSRHFQRVGPSDQCVCVFNTKDSYHFQNQLAALYHHHHHYYIHNSNKFKQILECQTPTSVQEPFSAWSSLFLSHLFLNQKQVCFHWLWPVD